MSSHDLTTSSVFTELIIAVLLFFLSVWVFIYCDLLNRAILCLSQNRATKIFPFRILYVPKTSELNTYFLYVTIFPFVFKNAQDRLTIFLKEKCIASFNLLEHVLFWLKYRSYYFYFSAFEINSFKALIVRNYKRTI